MCKSNVFDSNVDDGLETSVGLDLMSTRISIAICVNSSSSKVSGE